MTVVNDVVGAIQTFVRHLEEARTAASAAIDEADRGRDMAAAIGHDGTVEAFSAARNLIEEARSTVGSVIDKADEAREQTEAIKGG
jgi:hypothetical protein